ncbi:MAG TPA: mRNA surveillance protein pelota [Candidatus Thermoplasmatota archaeon]|nr:mRNA surveillance protein pelota [Candidatus Thermoplasmatota archaeon]
MKVLKEDARAGILRVRLDSPDDLWHLAQVLRPGDVVSGYGAREPLEATATKVEGGRTGKVEKKAMWLGVRLDSVEFQEFSTRLRVLGLIIEGPQDHGQHHTLSFEPGDDVEVRKARWALHELERVKEAVDASKRPLVLVLAIEENEAVVAALRSYGVQRLVDVSGHASGKRYGAGDRAGRESFFDEILLALRTNRPQGAPLLVVGPGFTREDFLAYAKEKEPATVAGSVVEPTGQAGMAGVHEALRRGAVERVQRDQRVSLETRLVERLLEAVATNGLAAYGDADVRRVLEAGAVETVLVTDDRMRAGGEVFLEAARATGAVGHVVSTHHEAGRRLKGLGGVAALLRYRP